MAWDVSLVDEVDEWYMDLLRSNKKAGNAVTAAIELLELEGPNLGRPIVDRVKGSKIHRMKELRPSGTSIRILFIFDPDRQAVLLVAGDKAGQWNKWYKDNIPEAEERYDQWLDEKKK